MARLSDRSLMWPLIIPLTWVALITTHLPQVASIGCFVCTSINGSEPDCEDTFNNTGRFYRDPCVAGRKGRGGLFPGTACIKLKAYHGDGYEILVRQCVVDNGDINSETEIGRIDHCGFVNSIKYNGNDMRGCILACDSDGCNRATESRAFHAVVPLTAAVVSVALRAGYS